MKLLFIIYLLHKRIYACFLTCKLAGLRMICETGGGPGPKVSQDAFHLENKNFPPSTFNLNLCQGLNHLCSFLIQN